MASADREALECRAAELGGVVVAIGVERSAPFPGVYGTSQRSRVSNRPLYLFDDRIGMTIRERDSGVGESRYCCLEGGAGLGRGLRPSGGSQHRQRARSSRRRRFGGTL